MKKILITSALALCIFSMGFSFAQKAQQRNEWEENREVITIHVFSGDTLDGIGYDYKPEWMDVREYREIIRELNDLDSCMLYAGQELKIYK